jgi:hypothetical protein
LGHIRQAPEAFRKGAKPGTDGCVRAAVSQHGAWREGARALGHIRQAPGSRSILTSRF